MRQMLKLVVTVLLVVGVCGTASAIGPLDLVDLNTTTPDNLAVQLGFTGANATVVGDATFVGTERSSGTFTNGLADGLGIQTGIVLTTGNLLNDPVEGFQSVVLGPNTLDTVDVSTENLLPGDADLGALIPVLGVPADTADASSLSFNFTTPFNTVTFRFVFGSEEFPVPVQNDVMGIFVDGVNVALVPGTINPISAFNLTSFNNNDPETLGVPTPFGSQLDGFSNVLTAIVPVTPNVQHTLKIAIADEFDGLADAAVFLAPATFTNTVAQLFLDVPPGSFAFDQIQAIAQAGITAGCGGGNFCPNNSITRAEMAVFLETSLGNPPNVCAGNVFADVPLGSFACGFIERLAADGITGGCGGGNFCPNGLVTRAQMAVFVEAALGNPANVCTNQFADSTAALVGATVCGFIERLAADGITAGCGGTNFCPNSPVTRAQMAVFLVAAPPPLNP